MPPFVSRSHRFSICVIGKFDRINNTEIMCLFMRYIVLNEVKWLRNEIDWVWMKIAKLKIKCTNIQQHIQIHVVNARGEWTFYRNSAVVLVRSFSSTIDIDCDLVSFLLIQTFFCNWIFVAAAAAVVVRWKNIPNGCAIGENWMKKIPRFLTIFILVKYVNGLANHDFRFVLLLLLVLRLHVSENPQAKHI